GRGLIHSPTSLAPLVRHDRVNETHQIVVTLWDLRAWETPEELSKTELLAARALLSRIGKHADAVVVPSHAMAERLAEVAKAKLVANGDAMVVPLPPDADDANLTAWVR
ncbi:hypothetical protein ACO1NF_13750, partial [Staphylococcus aureus]